MEVIIPFLGFLRILVYLDHIGKYSLAFIWNGQLKTSIKSITLRLLEVGDISNKSLPNIFKNQCRSTLKKGSNSTLAYVKNKIEVDRNSKEFIFYNFLKKYNCHKFPN